MSDYTLSNSAYTSGIKYGPADKLRRVVCQDPEWAYLYARDVDKGSHPITREAVCKDPLYAYMYAKWVDMCPSDETRKSANEHVVWGGRYASEVDWLFTHNETMEEEAENSKNNILNLKDLVQELNKVFDNASVVLLPLDGNKTYLQWRYVGFDANLWVTFKNNSVTVTIKDTIHIKDQKNSVVDVLTKDDASCIYWLAPKVTGTSSGTEEFVKFWYLACSTVSRVVNIGGASFPDFPRRCVIER